MHPTLLWSFARLVNSHALFAMSKAYFSCIAASTCSHLWISTLRTNSKSHQKMPHWPFLAVLGENVIIPPLLKWAPFPLRISPIVVESFDTVVILCRYFKCFFILNQMISYLFLALLTIITWRWFGRFIHNDHCRAFISPTLTHLQIVANTCAILYVTTSLFFMYFLVYKHIIL